MEWRNEWNGMEWNGMEWNGMKRLSKSRRVPTDVPGGSDLWH